MKLGALWNWNRTQDDRGQTVEVRAPREVQRQASIDPQLAAISDRTFALLMPNYTLWQFVQFGVVSMAVPVVALTILGQSAIYWIFIPYMLLLTLVMMTYNVRRYRKVVPKLARVFIEEGICAGCGYTLEHLLETDDRMLVCPECSAAWKSDRVLRFAPIATVNRTRTLRGELAHYLRLVTESVQRRGIRDDRDSPRVVIALYAMRKVRATGEHRERLDQVVNALKPAGRPKRALYTVVLTVSSAVLIAPIVMDTLFGAPPGRGSLWPALFGVFQLLLAITIPRSDTGRPCKKVWQAFISHQLCPCCAADLHGRAPEPDGCTVCPGCRAAWRYREPDAADSGSTPPPAPSAGAACRTPPSA